MLHDATYPFRNCPLLVLITLRDNAAWHADEPAPVLCVMSSARVLKNM